jgi:glyoxylase-like metal-dependent hydrolase (beta-lactamase superfamily II)
MLREERHGDVTRLIFESRRSRSMGFSVSAYVVRDTLIDTAFAQVGRGLDAWLDARRPNGVIVTHYHEDHAGNVARVARRGFPIWMSAETLERVRRPASIQPYRRWCWGSQPPLAAAPTPYQHAKLIAIHTPGHSADHHVVWDVETDTIFGADLFLGVKVRVSHPWPRENVRQEVASLRQIIALGPRRFFDAHRGLVNGAVSQLKAKADWMEETIGRIDALIARGWNDGAIQRSLLGREQLSQLVTGGDYSRRNFVASARGSMTNAGREKR